MTTIEIEKKISDAFRGGELRRRELRLTGEEAAYLRDHCAAALTPMGPGGDKTWYEITFGKAEN